MAKESALTLKIKKWLNEQDDSYFIKYHGGRFSSAGVSDLIGTYKGRFVGIEVKQPGKEKTLTRLQAMFIEKINKSGGVAFMATSIEGVKNGLRKVC